MCADFTSGLIAICESLREGADKSYKQALCTSPQFPLLRTAERNEEGFT